MTRSARNRSTSLVVALSLLAGLLVVGTAGAPPAVAQTPALELENNFVSAVGWVKPGDSYPFRVIVRNPSATAAAGAAVAVQPPDGAVFTQVSPPTGTTAAINGDGSITWTIGAVPAATGGVPAQLALVVEGEADTTTEDPQIVWKDLSSVATLTYSGGPAGLTSRSHGPKVIPPNEIYETARYGDRPFAVVPVDYFDRAHTAAHTGQALADKINSPSVPGSTFNLFQEMSYGQLYPHGTVPSAGIATRGWTVDWKSDRFTDNEFEFTDLQPNGTCNGATFSAVQNTPAYPNRIEDGWYQLPGTTNYYGTDRFGSAILGSETGVAALFDIDSACGPTAKGVFDAAHIADPEIDYSDYDTDKDGVVDFFMMVFTGVGGNGESQTSVPPYDNIWPHSSSLEFTYTDPDTGQHGYVSDDQLRDLEGRDLFYTNTTRTQMTTTDTGIPVYVRVGPYNVNPEDAIDNASVISHEYGHSLGLPDYYSTGGRSTYGDWNLMATDKSQHMDVNAKQELGWIVPRVLQPGETVASGWKDSKIDTNRIDWVDANGDPYTLSGPDVHNGEAYVAKLPPRLIIDPAKLTPSPPFVGGSPDHVWWSKSGNSFGCPPVGGHNLDIALPELDTIPSGTNVTITFKSKWDIEWDFDYGFVLVSQDNGDTYSSLASANNYTTPGAVNPFSIPCQTQYGNGLTGTSGSYAAGTSAVDRVNGDYPDGGFLADSYSFTSTGNPTILRFSYTTDVGVAKPGWFIDDLKITAGSTVLYDTDFEGEGDPQDPRVFNGGCKEELGGFCTKGWQFVNASNPSAADHAYYLEMRDRSGFDTDGKGENDRAAIAFQPGLLLVYTDEQHGYGNAGTDDPPAQSPLDANPQPGNQNPNLNDAAFKEIAGDRTYSDKPGDEGPNGHVDNYLNANPPGGNWTFGHDCLKFEVLAMSGRDVALPFNLQGDVRMTAGPGCAPFDYGYVDGPDEADLVVTKSDSPDPATVNQDLTYTIEVANNGPDTATGVTLTDVLPVNATLQSVTPGSPDCTGTTTVTCDLGTLLAGESTTVTIVVRPTSTAALTNTATVDSNTADPNAANDQAVATTTVGTGACTITGTSGNDLLRGTAGPDVICGLGGNDVITAAGGNDTILAGDGADVINGGGGDDTIDGGTGNDTIQPGAGDDDIEGGTGVNGVTYADAPSSVVINLGAGTVTGGSGTDTLARVQNAGGSNFDDRLTGDGGKNALDGRKGTDQLFGMGGADVLRGDVGNDVLDGGAGTDIATWTASTSGAVVDLGAGTASDGVGGTDVLVSIENAQGSNVGADSLTGDDGPNQLFGMGGNDSLFGKGGADRLDGGAGTDACDGGTGSTTFVACES